MQDRFSRLGGLATPGGTDGKSSGLGGQQSETSAQGCVAIISNPSVEPLRLEMCVLPGLSGSRLQV